MREILFKAKGQTTGKWFEGLLTRFDQDVCHIKDKYHEEWICDASTLCQYTGLIDKNGRKIWENDILRYSYDYPGSPWLKQKGLSDDDIKYCIGAVFWQDWRGTWAVCGKGKSRMTNQDVYVCNRNPNRTEVIGNIFDNPELLKDGDSV